MKSKFFRPLNYFILSLIVIDGTFGAIPFGISDTAGGVRAILGIEWVVTVAFMIITFLLIISLMFNLRRILNWTTLAGASLWLFATIAGGFEFIRLLDAPTTIGLLGASMGMALFHVGVFLISVTEEGYQKHIHENDFLDT